MLIGVNQDYTHTLLAQDRRQHGTGESITENGDIKVVFGFLHYHSLLLIS
jgi:hypothetical protein